MASKKPNSTRLFQLALKDVIKSNAGKLERNSQWVSTKERIPLTMEPHHGIPSKQKVSLAQDHGSVSSLLSKDLNKSFQKISQPPTDPVNLYTSGSNCSLANENPIFVQEESTSINALPISVFEQSNARTETDSSNPKWIKPPSYNLSTFSNGEELNKLHGDQFECDLFPELLSGKTCGAHLSEESRTVEWPLTSELSDIRSIIPAPKTADDFFNSSSYIKQINALDCKAVISNPKSCEIISDSLLFGDQIGYQNTRTAIPSPKPCDNIPSFFPFSDVVSSKNTEVSLPTPSYYEYLSNSETFSNNEYSQHSIPTTKNLNFSNSFPPGDASCLSNSEMTIPSPKSYSNFDSSVPLAGEVCSTNCDMIVSAKQFQKCSKELNSDFYENQKITCGSKCSSLKCDLRTEYSKENSSKSCGSDICNCNLPSCNFYTSVSKPSENLCQKLPNLRKCKNELKKHFACDEVFPNDYLDELIKLGSNECDIYRNEKDNLEDTFTKNYKQLNYCDNLTNFVNKRKYEPLHTFHLENHNLKPSTSTRVENPRLVDFDETSTGQKSVIELNDANMSKLDFDYLINQSNVCSNIPHSQTHLDQSCTKPINYCKSESELHTVPPFLDRFDLLRVDSIDNRMSNLTVSETKSTDNFKTSGCFEDRANSVEDTNSLLCFYGQADDYSTSRFTTSLDSLVDSKFENGTNTVVSMSVDSCRSTSTNSINEMFASDQNCISLVSGVFCNDSKSNSSLECNRSTGSFVGEPSFFRKPSTSTDSGVGFLLEDTTSNASLDKSCTCSELELNVFSNIPNKNSSKLVCLDKSVINADFQVKNSATSTKFSENNKSDFLVDDQQRIDNLIDQFLKM